MNYSQKKTNHILQTVRTDPTSSDKSCSIKNVTMLSATAATIFLLFYAPNECKVSLLVGYKTCVEQLLFSLFPFMIIANTLSSYDYIALLGIPFQRLMQWVGFPEKSAGGLFSLALLGGFAPAISALTTKIKSNEFPPTQASYFLSIICFLGPSYVILAVGGGMLHSVRTGCYLFTSQVLANLCSVWLLSRLPRTTTTLKLERPQQQQEQHTTPNDNATFASLISDSFFSFLRLCSVLLYFQFLSTGIRLFIPKQYQWFLEMFLEVTNACNSIAQSGIQASFRCSIALSFISASILLQARSLCPKEVSFRPFLFSRLLQLPIALLFLRLLLYIPQTQATYNSLPARVILMPRVPLDQAMALFIALVFLAERLRKPLQRR